MTNNKLNSQMVADTVITQINEGSENKGGESSRFSDLTHENSNLSPDPSPAVRLNTSEKQSLVNLQQVSKKNLTRAGCSAVKTIISVPGNSTRPGVNTNVSNNTALQETENQLSTPTGDLSGKQTDTGGQNKQAKIVLQCQAKSHQFKTRIILLTPKFEYRVGRAFSRKEASEVNARFDCKVLSRKHAILWYSEDKKFWVKDTGSSNGTYVNGKKLGPEAAELHFGDIIQFGEDVFEKLDNKVRHCIVASVRLYLPDGGEATSSASKTHSLSQLRTGVRNNDENLHNAYKDVQQRLSKVETSLAVSKRECELLRDEIITSKQSMKEINERLTRMDATFDQYKKTAQHQLLEAKEQCEQRETFLLGRLLQSDLECVAIKKSNQLKSTDTAKLCDDINKLQKKAFDNFEAAITKKGSRKM